MEMKRGNKMGKGHEVKAVKLLMQENDGEESRNHVYGIIGQP